LAPTENIAPPVWVLLGKWHGDNQQLLAIAEALNVPFRVIPLRLNKASGLSAALLGSSRLSWHTDEELVAPWPRIVLVAGRRSVPAARWIQQQSGGYTRLVSINRPWVPLSWFDLVITTPQYALPARPNVLSNLLPFLSPPDAGEAPPAQWLPAEALSMPRPWTAVLIGGKTKPYEFSDATARALADTVNRHVREFGGSAWLLDSPRTPRNTLSIVERHLEVPSHVIPWRGGKKPYSALLASADRFIVTEDSASMLTEALLSGRPVDLFPLHAQPNWKGRLAARWHQAAERAPSSVWARSFEIAVGQGWLTSVRDLRLLHRALRQAGLFGEAGCARDLAERERHVTLARIHAVMAYARSDQLARQPAAAAIPADCIGKAGLQIEARGPARSLG